MYSLISERIALQNVEETPSEHRSNSFAVSALPSGRQQMALRFPFCLPSVMGLEPNFGRAELKTVNNIFRTG